ncbi:xanthine dehydrogenase family protein subunit M [Ferruginibacter paludis]|uniref:FAD binding domain-containing protein n=1 Tax=Ferruginibacter paludis TaxID=1310417 RepID=UPI0025B44477|nr:xanthine dehydrogenase family protein subunit M [Ferruginibacter paludis]MDN3657409.1 xanthine dehydrogenase family protein subunit M [Ferruginibacter paludis]
MRPFKFSTTADSNEVSKILIANPHARLLGGGTNLLDLMKEDVERPTELVEVGNIDVMKIVSPASATGSIVIPAVEKNARTANDPAIRENFPMLSQAILSGASAQIRNMATNGGNLNQRTRCTYFYDVAMPCNKREPGSGCGAMKGLNRMHAIFGWSDKCVAVHPSDMCVALAALDAVVKVQGANGKQRSIPFTAYHRLPGDQPQKDNTLQPGELITAIEIPKNNFAENSYYLKVRDRASYAFALISVAAAMELKNNKIVRVSIAMGGVAHKPWRASVAEKYLLHKEATEANFKIAAANEMKLAKPLEHNLYKVELGRKALVRALMQAANGGKTI